MASRWKVGSGQGCLSSRFLAVGVVWAAVSFGLKTPAGCTPFPDGSSTGPHVEQEARGHQGKDREAHGQGMTETWGSGWGGRRSAKVPAGSAGTPKSWPLTRALKEHRAGHECVVRRSWWPRPLAGWNKWQGLDQQMRCLQVREAAAAGRKRQRCGPCP